MESDDEDELPDFPLTPPPFTRDIRFYLTLVPCKKQNKQPETKNCNIKELNSINQPEPKPEPKLDQPEKKPGLYNYFYPLVKVDGQWVKPSRKTKSISISNKVV